MSAVEELITANSPGAKEDYLSELKRLVLLHARAQNLPAARCSQLLSRIQADGSDTVASWVSVWSEAARDCESRGKHLQSSAYYGVARFPYVDCAGRAQAHRACVQAFTSWAFSRGIERMEVRGPAGRTALWIKRGPARSRRLLLVVGGIVSIKEQWARLLDLSSRVGATVALTEMPGVGENTLRYGPDSWRMFPQLLDQLRDAFGVEDADLIALSFGGHLAMRAALHDPRIRSIITVGAPVARLFQDSDLWRTLPETTVRTLAHVAGVPRELAQQHLSTLALSTEELSRLRIPIFYFASLRDEIIPHSEWQLLRNHAPSVAIFEHDDVHGSPHHMVRMRLRILGILLDLQQRQGLLRFLIAFILAMDFGPKLAQV